MSRQAGASAPPSVPGNARSLPSEPAPGRGGATAHYARSAHSHEISVIAQGTGHGRVYGALRSSRYLPAREAGTGGSPIRGTHPRGQRGRTALQPRASAAPRANIRQQRLCPAHMHGASHRPHTALHRTYSLSRRGVGALHTTLRGPSANYRGSPNGGPGSKSLTRGFKSQPAQKARLRAKL